MFNLDESEESNYGLLDFDYGKNSDWNEMDNFLELDIGEFEEAPEPSPIKSNLSNNLLSKATEPPKLIGFYSPSLKMFVECTE